MLIKVATVTDREVNGMVGIMTPLLPQSRRALVASASDQERFVKVAAAEGQVVKVREA